MERFFKNIKNSEKKSVKAFDVEFNKNVAKPLGFVFRNFSMSFPFQN